jgi:hypothetical protein
LGRRTENSRTPRRSRPRHLRSPSHTISSISSLSSVSLRSPSILRHSRSPSPIRQRRLSFGLGNERSPRNSPITRYETSFESPQTSFESPQTPLEYPQTSDRQYRHRRWW